MENVCTPPTCSPTPGTSDQGISSFPVFWDVLSRSDVSDSSQPHGLYSPPGFSVHGFLQTRILEWVAIPYPGNLPNPGIKPGSLASPALEGEFCCCCFLEGELFFFVFSPPLRHLGSPQRGRLLWDRITLSDSGPSRHCRTCLCFLLMPLSP